MLFPLRGRETDELAVRVATKKMRRGLTLVDGVGAGGEGEEDDESGALLHRDREEVAKLAANVVEVEDVAAPLAVEVERLRETQILLRQRREPVAESLVDKSFAHRPVRIRLDLERKFEESVHAGSALFDGDLSAKGRRLAINRAEGRRREERDGGRSGAGGDEKR
jgi:hypothetical protein